MNHEATAKVMKKSEPAKHGPVHSVTFKKVKGGIISTTMHNSADPEQASYVHSVDAVHKSMGDAKKHLATCMGDCPEGEMSE